MSINVGGIDLAQGVLDAQYRISVLEKIVERLIRITPIGSVSEAEIKAFQAQALAELQQRYPQAGIQRK